MKELVRYVKPHRWWFIIAIGFSLSEVIIALVPPAVSGRIVDGVFIASVTDGRFAERHTLLLLLIGAIALATVGRAASIYLRNLFLEVASQRVLRDLKQAYYDHVQSLSFHFFHHTRTGELMARITNDMEMIRGALVLLVMHGTTGVFFFVASSLVLLTINWQLTLISIIASPALFGFTYAFRKAIFPRFQANRRAYSQLNTAVQENISGIRIVKSLMRHGEELRKFRAKNHGLTESRNRSLLVWAKFMPIIELLSGVASVLVLLFGGRMVINGTMSLGRWVEFNSYLWMLVVPMRMLGEVVNQVALAEASIERIFEIMHHTPQIASASSAQTPPTVRGEVEFRDVSWGAEGQAILDHVSLHAKPGSTIAIMGATGSGKSSLVQLIPRFYDPAAGTILIDGIDIRELNLVTLRENVAFVAQETFLFSETMLNNLTYGSEGKPVEFVQRVASQTQAHGFIKAMSEGYETVVGERGVGLSGGQKQRAGLARALIKEAPILILDDSTSAVDMETEAQIQAAIRNQARKVTTFIIAHRISSVRHADEIIVLDGGRVVERGTHKELLAAAGHYAQYYRVQYADADTLNGRSA